MRNCGQEIALGAFVPVAYPQYVRSHLHCADGLFIFDIWFDLLLFKDLNCFLASSLMLQHWSVTLAMSSIRPIIRVMKSLGVLLGRALKVRYTLRSLSSMKVSCVVVTNRLRAKVNLN